MFNTLKTSFQIDITYAINSFIATINRTPIIKEFVSDNLYRNELAKKWIRLLAIFCTTLRMIIGKIFYFSVIYGVLYFLFRDVTKELFIHTFFFFSMIGMLINSHILSVGKKKYYAIILMKMNAKKYVTAYFVYDMLTTFFLNFGGLAIFCTGLFKMNLLFPILLSFLVVFLKIIGEAISIYFYQKTKTLLGSKLSVYFTILILGLFASLALPYFGIILNLSVYVPISLFLFFLAFFACFYILSIKEYQSMYKKINTLQAIMNQENATAYNRQLIVEMNKKDYKINEKKLKGKKGYAYFNTIFFLRHKVILSNSANMFALFSFLAFGLLSIILIMEPNEQQTVLNFLENNFSWIILIMYFVNRGAIMTQAMFYNCDRSMLTFRFFKEPKGILNLFRERLKTMIWVNLPPAIVIATGVLAILIICTHTFLPSYLFVFISVITLSIFFSTHHLVLYYLLQPYNTSMEMKSISFSLANFLTYFACYLCKDITLSYGLFSLFVIGLTVSYIVLSLIAVYQKSSETFKLK